MSDTTHSCLRCSAVAVAGSRMCVNCLAETSEGQPVAPLGTRVPAYSCTRCGKLAPIGTNCPCSSISQKGLDSILAKTPAEKQQQELLESLLAKFSANMRAANSTGNHRTESSIFATITANYANIVNYLNGKPL